MAKRKTDPISEQSDGEPIGREQIDIAIDMGKQMISEGKTKIEAAMAIYGQLKNLPQQTVVDAFIAGASLTPKGALTYWYTCRRRSNRME